MHELSLTRSIVETCSQRAGDARVLRVTVEVGALSCVLPEALRFCYDVIAADTPLAGSELEIIHVPAHSRCRSCGQDVAMRDLLSICCCGSSDLEPPQGGDQLRVKSMEIEEFA